MGLSRLNSWNHQPKLGYRYLGTPTLIVNSMVRSVQCPIPVCLLNEIKNFRLICQFYHGIELKRLPLASIGNIPSNICRKQSSSVGLSLLHCFNQSAANKTNQSKYINVHLTQLNVEKKRTKKCLNWVETYIHLTEEIEKPNFKIFHFFVSTKYEVRYNMQRECAVH